MRCKDVISIFSLVVLSFILTMDRTLAEEPPKTTPKTNQESVQTTSPSPPSRPSNRDAISSTQYQKVVYYLKVLARHMKDVEQKLKTMSEKNPNAKDGGSGGGTGEDDNSIDLSSLDSATGLGVSSSSPPNRPGSHGVSFPDLPLLKTYFDFNIISRPGYSDFTFDNYHAFLLFELVPTPDVQFSFEVNPNPKFYELDYQLKSWLQIRVGKIWIPFDDLTPHNIFGGRVNVSRLAPGAAFLPDLWTDLGIGLKFSLIQRTALSLDAHAYVVNGFRSGGSDPRNPASGADAYPSFSDLPTLADNNKNKAWGVRFHSMLRIPTGLSLGLGTSYYQGRWTSEENPRKNLNLIGLDAQARLGLTEIRTGVVSVNVELPNDDRFSSAGFYGELGQRLDANNKWKILGRIGRVQMDDRVIDVTDQTIAGVSLLYTPNFLQLSIEHSRDLQKLGRKLGYAYTAARVVMAF